MKIMLFNRNITNKYINRSINFEIVGYNTGNLLFWYALKKILNAKSHTIQDCKINNIDINQFDAFVTTDLIWIRENVSMNWVKPQLDLAGHKRLVPISIGLQADYYKPDFKLHPDTINLLKSIEEKSIMGVRGYYTAEILNKYGIKNIEVIGCPSLYYNMDQNYEIKMDNSHKKEIICNFRSFHSKLNADEIKFLKYCARYNFKFCEQTMQPFSLEICPEYHFFSPIYKWLNINRFLFFDINDWLEFAKASQFSIGARFHGNVMTLWNNKPALFIAIDSRTKEMTEFFKLPTIYINEFDDCKDINFYYEKADYSEFNKSYSQLYYNFTDFLKKNHIQ